MAAALVALGCGTDSAAPVAPSTRDVPMRRFQATWAGGSNTTCSPGTVALVASPAVIRPGQQTTVTNDAFYQGYHDWLSSNTGVATVAAADHYTNVATVTGVAPGQTCISVIVQPLNGAGNSGNVRVSVAGLTVSPASVNLGAGTTQQLTLTQAIANDGNVIASGTITWTSANPSIATVDATGLVTAKAAGSTTVTASIGGQTASVPVSVSLVASITGHTCVRQTTYGQWYAAASGGVPPYQYAWYRNNVYVGSASSYTEYISPSTYPVGAEIQMNLLLTDANGHASNAYYLTWVQAYTTSDPSCYY